MGSIDQPFNPLSLALGAEATFVARTIDTDKKTMTEVLRKAALHQGSAYVEIYQNCNIYNDGAFDLVRDDASNRIVLRQGEPIRFGEEGEKGVVQRRDGSAAVVDVAEVGEDALLRHDEHHEEPSLAFALSRLTLGTVGATPIGVFRDVERPVYDELMTSQIEQARADRGEGDLRALVGSGDTWTID
jgi:2-oxoglutarate ferredoxin oxidoreductase subunit beta